MDVLEHIKDDVGAVAWARRHLAPGGYLLVTVPANPCLWTEMDEVVGHYRRYRRRDLLGLFGGGFDVVHCSFYNGILFPIKVGFVGFTRVREYVFPEAEKRSFNETPPGPINELMKLALFLEARLIPFVSLPAGVSIVLVAKKRASACDANS
jgi:SAM-dependent methyltransferase